jgi:hypothetical protein
LWALLLGLGELLRSQCILFFELLQAPDELRDLWAVMRSLLWRKKCGKENTF